MEAVKEKQSKELVKVEVNGTKKSIIFKEILKHNIVFIIGSILLICKALLLNHLIDLQIGKELVQYTTLVVLFIMCPTINSKGKFSYIYFNIIYAILTLIIFADFVYYNYSTNFLSFYQITNLQYTKEITSGFFSIIEFRWVLLFWVDNLVILGLSIFACKKLVKPSLQKENVKLRNIGRIIKAFAILVIIGCNIYIVDTKINGIYKIREYNKSLIVQEASIYYYHFEDAKDYFNSWFEKEDVDEEKMQAIYAEYIETGDEETDYTGVADDSNVIILQMESLAEYVIGKQVNGKEITPNLNKFFSENIYCSDMYNQGLGSTADSEFSMENSMYPLENGYVFQKYYDNTWMDIFSVLKEEGYYTSFMHPNTSTFWNREEVYNTGYKVDEYNDIRTFTDIEKAGEFYSDEGFFEEAVNIMASYEGNFCTVLVSVTAHIPFYLDGVSDLESKLTLTEEDVEYFEDETFRNYLLSCNFVDYAFGQFLIKLEEEGLLENSILVVYGDHGPGLSCTEDLEKLYSENGLVYSDFEDTITEIHIPFGIKIPEVDSNETINRSVSKIDIKPTILDLLGVEDKFSIGRTIFSDKDYSFIKGLGFITSTRYCINDIFYDRNTNTEIDEDESLRKLLEQMESEIYFSDTIIKNNLLKTIS